MRPQSASQSREPSNRCRARYAAERRGTSLPLMNATVGTRRNPFGRGITAPAGPWLCVALMSAQITACDARAPEDSYARGHRRSIATVSTEAESQMIDAAVREAFDVDPSLTLRVHPRRLPRQAGDSGGAPVPSGLVKSLRDRGLVIGSCEPVRESPRDTPRCGGPEAGYIIRASDVFVITRDTFEINVAAEKFGAATGQKPEALRFEKVYQLVKDGQRWRVAREGRVRQ